MTETGKSVHPRTLAVKEAASALHEFLVDWITRFNLTFAERVKVFGEVLSMMTATIIRNERHPHRPDKDADEI